VNLSASPMPRCEVVPTPAFEGMVATDRRRLYTLAVSILRDEGEAEDAVQETLLKAWRSWSALAHTSYVSRWLTRVCVNHCISRRRFLRLRGWRELGLFAGVASSDHQDGRADVLDIDRVYRRLSPRQRAAITLTFRYGYSVDECAELMECRPRTVRTHLTRGLATLRKELSDD
jgi:RNA polymerase sigma-70 factor (ECF subfamily)